MRKIRTTSCESWMNAASSWSSTSLCGLAGKVSIWSSSTTQPHRADLRTYGWMDWSDLQSPGFFLRAVNRLEDLVAHGACGLKLWKDLGTSLTDADGKLLRVDDERLAPLFEKAAELGVPIMFHTADPDAFFLPIDPENERYEELAAHPEWSFHGEGPRNRPHRRGRQASARG